MRLLAVPVLLAALLAGCSSQSPAPAPAASAPAGQAGQATALDPVALIGNWLVTGTDEKEGTILRLAGEPRELALWRSCGMLSGSWRANDVGLFVGDVAGYSVCQPPPADQQWTPGWLARVTGYRLDGEARELLDVSGEVVARLLPGGEPVVPNPKLISPDLAKKPEVTDAARRALAPAAPLPAGLTPATRDSLAGRWVAADGVKRPNEASLDLKTDGTWSGSDGCNGSRGRWVAGAGGTLLATSGPTTLIACGNFSGPSWLSEARRAAIDGDHLILFDSAGKELGRLKHG